MPVWLILIRRIGALSRPLDRIRRCVAEFLPRHLLRPLRASTPQQQQADIPGDCIAIARSRAGPCLISLVDRSIVVLDLRLPILARIRRKVWAAAIPG